MKNDDVWDDQPMTNTGGKETTGAGAGGGGIPPIMPADVADGEKNGPPSWMLPAAVGLVAALVIALGVVLLTGDQADAPVASEPATSVVPDTGVTTAPVVVEPVVTEPAVTEPVATEAPLPDTVPAPEPTDAPAPETTAAPAPETTTAPLAEVAVQPARPGFVRIFSDEFPIERICQSSPFPGFGLTTFVFDDNGVPEVVELGNDEGNEFGLVFGDGYPVIDLGDDGFGIEAEQGDSVVQVSVNQGDLFAGPCPGFSTVSNTSTPGFQDVTHAVVDVCLGDVPRFDDNNEFSVGFGYRGIIAEGGQFVARPGANGGVFAVDYNGPAGAFNASTDSAMSVDIPNGFQIRADLVGDPNGAFAGETRTVVIDIDESLVETCGTI